MTLPQDAIGKELILDLYDCDINKMNRESLDNFFVSLCEKIDMTRTELFYWEYLSDDEKDPEEFSHLKGLSAVQFIKTSNITLHTFENDRKISLNIFSCKDFNAFEAEMFCLEYFNAQVKQSVTLCRY
jgi:S-adenosylmethionine/arginine decarboxylase-like enzyme